MRSLKLVFLVVFLLSSSVLAEEIEQDKIVDEKRSIVLLPLLNVILPGFTQVVDGEPGKASLFFGTALTGFLINGAARRNLEEFRQSDSERYHSYRDNQRAEGIGEALIKHASYVSLYDGFLTRVKDYQAEGKYLFLPNEQNLESIHKAPFNFQYMKRATTWIPFLLAVGLGVSEFNESPSPNKFDMRPIDGLSSVSRSYAAGVGEEAFFRGWMQPVLYENTQSYWLSNTIQAVVFGYAHGPTPYPQLAFGFYTGWLVPENSWDMGEAIFIHTWWDIILMNVSFARSRSLTKDFNIQLPLINARF